MLRAAGRSRALYRSNMKEGERWVRQRETESYFPPQVPVKRQSHLSSHAGSFMTSQGAIIGGRQPAGLQHWHVAAHIEPHVRLCLWRLREVRNNEFGILCGIIKKISPLCLSQKKPGCSVFFWAVESFMVTLCPPRTGKSTQRNFMKVPCLFLDLYFSY